MVEGKWILKFNKAVIHGCKYNPGEMAAFTPREAQIIMDGPPVDDQQDPNYRKKPAEVVKKLEAHEVMAIEGRGQPDAALIIDSTRLNAGDLAKINKIIEEAKGRDKVPA